MRAPHAGRDPVSFEWPLKPRTDLETLRGSVCSGWLSIRPKAVGQGMQGSRQALGNRALGNRGAADWAGAQGVPAGGSQARPDLTRVKSSKRHMTLTIISLPVHRQSGQSRPRYCSNARRRGPVMSARAHQNPAGQSYAGSWRH